MLIVANWKAYIADLKKAQALLTQSKRLARATNTTIILAPPGPFLGALAAKRGNLVAFAAQDVSSITGGAHTGEVTALTYRESGAAYAIVGHSERRTAGDTGEMVAEKVAHALANELTPVLCVGEAVRDEQGRYLVSVREQITSALMPLTGKERRQVIIAYEPRWAIGQHAEHAITPTDLGEMILYIRKVLAELLPGRSATGAQVLYGGAVEAENVRALAQVAQVDGFLVGHASTDPGTFTALVRAAA